MINFPFNSSILFVLLLSASYLLADVHGAFNCPEPYGLFEDPEQCDKYFECKDNFAEEKLCPDGLVFDPFKKRGNPCDNYFIVNCGTRLKLQEAKGRSEFCPRLNGEYAHPNPRICNIFYTCVDGAHEIFSCTSGLWFDEYEGICNWPEHTRRANCTTEHQQLESGFKCPKLDNVEGSDPHPKYPDESDCAKFYICLNGVSPRVQGCEKGLVFNVLTKQCDAPENVPECKDYYATTNF